MMKPITTASLLALSACATVSESTKQQEVDSMAAVEAAEAVDARDTPKSALYLKKANDHLAAGKKYLEEGEETKGRRALEKAQVDAELAVATAKLESARSEAEEAREKAKILQRSM